MILLNFVKDNLGQVKIERVGQTNAVDQNIGQFLANCLAQA